MYDGEVRIDFTGCEELVIHEAPDAPAAPAGEGSPEKEASGVAAQTEDTAALDAAVSGLIDLFEVTADGAAVAVNGLRVEGTSLFLACGGVSENTEEIEVRFAQKPYYVVNLYNEIGIPAAPFII